MKKFIIDWFRKVEDGELRYELLSNFHMNPSDHKHQTCKSLADAIISGFNWNDTPQKHKYWGKIYNKVSKLEQAQKANSKIKLI